MSGTVDECAAAVGLPAKRTKFEGDEAPAPPLDGDSEGTHNFNFSDTAFSLEDIRQRQAQFSEERNWDQDDTPRNMILALTAEVGELAEIFQWKEKVSVGLPDFTENERVHVGQEMSDCLIKLVRLADRCKIDLPAAVKEKFSLNAKKYPKEKVHGLCKKYSEYKNYEQS